MGWISILSPDVSVLLAVYNGEQHVSAAIDSVLAQDMEDWELVIVDDGSTDSTPDLLSNWSDPRIRVLRTGNQGLTKALNHGLRNCRGRFIARLDADDRCLPSRLRLQARALDDHPDIAAVGSAYYEVLVEHMSVRMCEVPATHEVCLEGLLQGRSVFLHSSVMFRRRLKGQPIRYDESYPEAQDQRLWIYLASRSRLGSVSRPLVVALRNDPNSITGRRGLINEVRLKTRLIIAARDELGGSGRQMRSAIARSISHTVASRLRRYLRETLMRSLGEARVNSLLWGWRGGRPVTLTWSEVDALWRVQGD